MHDRRQRQMCIRDRVNITAHAFSSTAKEAIEKVGGSTATL
jgi:ribosomal protein L18E